MIGFCCRRLQLLFPSRSSAVNSVHFTRLYSSTSLLGSTQNEKDCSFTVSYLVNSCGLSPELALSLFKKQRVQFESRERPDSVVKLFKGYGFGDTHISEIVKRLPELLIVNAEKTLLPKLEFFDSVGIKGTTLIQVLCGNPIVLKLSLENNIRPCYDIIKTLGLPDEKVPRFIMKSHRMFKVSVLSNVACNVSFLRSIKVPESTLNLCRPETLFTVSTDVDVFDENVSKVIHMGFPPSSCAFVKALYVVFVMDESKLAERMEFYRKWGWTENDVLLALRKNPIFICYSEKIISRKLDFYLNVMDCHPSDVAGYPDVLTYSLEKRIIPRCSVIRVLQLKGLIAKEDVSINTLLKRREKWFLDSFVVKYQEQVPELLSIFQGKMDLTELGLGSVKRYEVKQQCDN